MIEKEYKTMLNYEKYIRLLEVFHFEEALVHLIGLLLSELSTP